MQDSVTRLTLEVDDRNPAPLDQPTCAPADAATSDGKSPTPAALVPQHLNHGLPVLLAYTIRGEGTPVEECSSLTQEDQKACMQCRVRRLNVRPSFNDDCDSIIIDTVSSTECFAIAEAAPSGSIIVAGRKKTTCNDKGFVAKVRPNGSIAWNISLGLDDSDAVVGAVELGPGEYAAAGWVTQAKGNCEESSKEQELPRRFSVWGLKEVAAGDGLDAYPHWTQVLKAASATTSWGKAMAITRGADGRPVAVGVEATDLGTARHAAYLLRLGIDGKHECNGVEDAVGCSLQDVTPVGGNP